MTLDQFQDLRQWHLRRQIDQPMEGHAWTAIVTLWMAGWVGAPIAWLLQADLAAIAAVALMFAPGRYVAWRGRLHRQGWLRCDWIVLLR